MKKIYKVLIYVLLAAVLGVFIWCQRPGLGMAQVLPSHPLFFARLDHVETHTQQLIHSDFGKSVAAINLPEVLNRNNFAANDVRDFERWQDDLVKLWGNPLMRKFLGKEAAVAVYHSQGGYQVFIVLRLTMATRIAELIGQLSHHWGDEITLHQQRYQNRVINKLTFKNQHYGFNYVRIRDLLIITPESLGNVEDIIDVYQRKREALDTDPAFNFVRQNGYPSADGLIFVNANAILDLWRGQVDSHLSSLGYHAGAFPVYGMSYMPDGAISKYKMLVGLDEDHMPSGLRKAFDCPALANETLKLVPDNAIAYTWGGCYDFQQAWHMAKQRLDVYPDLGNEVLIFKQRIEDHFQVNIKNDVLPLLGHEIGGYLTDVDMEGTLPFPRLLVFIKMNDRPKAEALLAKLTGNAQTTFHHEVYNQVDIHYIDHIVLPSDTAALLGANMDPGYAFLDNYLLMATTRQLLKRSIDAYDDTLHSIESDDVIAQFSLSSDQKFNAVTLMKTAELSRRAQDFLGWVDKYLSGQVTMAAAYKQDGKSKKDELDQAIADKHAELLLAHQKLLQLKNVPITDSVLEDPDVVNGAIANLNREEAAIKDDIENYTAQKADLARILDNYATNAQSDKLTMYNMDNILSPVLKGLESIDAQAVTVRYGHKILETELLVK